MVNRGIRNRLNSLKLTGFLAVLVVPLLLGTKHFQTVSDGGQIFQANCAGCHTIGGGDLIGPDLMGVTKRQDSQWLTSFISNPGKMIASGDPVAVSLYKKYGNLTMPSLGLSSEQVAAVIAYLESQSGGSQNANVTPAVNLPPGDAARGKALFMGIVHFHNDGPPCMGCHNFGSNGILGGGALGPDLTRVATKYNEASLAAALANIPFPNMKPIFTRHPLTAEEQADLRAFLLAKTSSQATNKEMWVIGISLVGLVGAALLVGLLYRRRLQPVRRTLVERVRSVK